MRFERTFYDSRFDRFLVAERVDLDELAARIGWSRQNLGRLRKPNNKPNSDTIARVVLALRDMLGRAVAASELFYLGEAHDDDSPEARAFRRVA
jgi:hypothetical protein